MGTGKFKGITVTKQEYCTFMYQVTKSDLPAIVRKMALKAIALKTCYNKRLTARLTANTGRRRKLKKILNSQNTDL